MDDISDTLAPKSDQLDAVDLLGGPRVFTVESASVRNGDEQPVSIRLREFPRVWRPGKSMRRVLAACWGVQSSEWSGRQVELFCDPSVKFGGEAVGGTRIRSLSHIDGPKSVPLLITRGKSAIYVVEPLTEAPTKPAEPTVEQVAACTDTAALGAMWKVSSPQMRAHIEDRVAALKAQAEPEQGAMFPEGDQR